MNHSSSALSLKSLLPPEGANALPLGGQAPLRRSLRSLSTPQTWGTVSPTPPLAHCLIGKELMLQCASQIRGEVINLGLVDFAKVWELQKKIICQIKEGKQQFVLIICRHFPVMTFGRRDGRKDLLVPDEALKTRGIAIYDIERGGRATYHGPGQLTVYPIVDLSYFKKDIHWFLRALEGVIISCLSSFGILANQRSGLTGVWVGEKKICSIGIAIKNWISWHGLSLNVSVGDLENFALIRPCGMDIAVTAMEEELNRHLEIEPVAESLVRHFSQILPIGN